jgi:hypothetical protein
MTKPPTRASEQAARAMARAFEGAGNADTAMISEQVAEAIRAQFAALPQIEGRDAAAEACTKLLAARPSAQ